MTRIVLGPFNRVEGDLEVALDVTDGKVQAAYVNSPMFRGFEQILIGKHPFDALVIAPRICGICSVSQSVASAYALANLMGVDMPPNGELATNLLLANENVADHLTHFYLFFMPDFARTEYSNRPWFKRAEARFKAVTGSATAQVMPERTAFLQMMGFLGGKWPHTLSIQPGGSARAVDTAEKIRLMAVLQQFRRFLESTLFGDTLENVCALDSAQALGNWRARDSDFALFLDIADDLQLSQAGRAHDRFMSYGNYLTNGERLFPAGLWENGAKALDIDTISEDVSHSWMRDDTPLHPQEGITIPDMARDGAYTWCKAPRLNGLPVETGALARQVVAGHALVRDLVATSGGNVRNRVIARILEIARIHMSMENWVKQLQPGQPFCNQAPLPKEGMGQGLVEAARGSLGHWITVSHGKIQSYQIVAPTTWNFSPRDASGIPGALEKALESAPVGEHTVLVQHIVRSFDPCMVCTVH